MKYFSFFFWPLDKTENKCSCLVRGKVIIKEGPGGTYPVAGVDARLGSENGAPGATDGSGAATGAAAAPPRVRPLRDATPSLGHLLRQRAERPIWLLALRKCHRKLTRIKMAILSRKCPFLPWGNPSGWPKEY